MLVKRGNIKELYSCNGCKRGKLKEDGRGMEYPYEHVTLIEVIGSSIRLCDECIKELKEGIESTESPNEVEAEKE